MKENVTWPLEYLMLFGIPDNKVELVDGRSRWCFPFKSRADAETHFAAWLETLSRWKGVSTPAIHKSGSRWQVEMAGATMELYPKPIELHFRIEWEAFDAFHSTFWQPEMWPGDWPTWHRWMLAQMDHQDVRMNLWVLFGELCERHGGIHSGRTGIVLSDTAAVEPDQFVFRKSKDEYMIEGNYFQGVPDLIAEVLSPASRSIDRGPRQEVYRRAGVLNLWLLDPALETVEVLERQHSDYRQMVLLRGDDMLETRLFPGERIHVNDLFKTQSKRFEDRKKAHEPEPIPEWIVPPEKQLGLEHFFLLGHPEHRWEIWGNRAPNVLAFGSVEEAKSRLGHFIEEACRWECVASTRPSSLAPDIDQAEIGRFKFTRNGRHVHLDVAVDARKYRELLRVWAKREVWDWGEEGAEDSSAVET